MHGNSRDGCTIVGLDAREDSSDKRGIGISEPDRSFMAESPLHIIIESGLNLPLHRFYATDDIRTEEITPSEFSICELHFPEIPRSEGSVHVISPDLDA